MAHIQNDVVVVAHVASDGHVIGVPNAPTGHPILAKVAEENIKTWRFQSDAEEEVKITYHFKVQGKPTHDYPLTTCEFDFPDSVTIITNTPAPNP